MSEVKHEANAEHEWSLSSSGDPLKEGEVFFVIDTVPEKYTYYCKCGAVTHDPETGESCPIKHYS